MAFREVFAKLLNEETDWSAPENKATAQAEADADDGQDPGKKLFWSTNHPDDYRRAVHRLGRSQRRA